MAQELHNAEIFSNPPASLPDRHRPEPLPREIAAANLAALEEQAHREMELLGHNHDWVPAPEEGTYNVLIIGGGQAGLGSAFALSRHRIDHVKVLDDSPEEFVGPWARYARMHTLRSPKNMKGIELDIPSLHTESWFKAKYGPEAWEATTLVPRMDWHEYLTWYRKVTRADVDFETAVTEMMPPSTGDGLFTVRASRQGEVVEYRARRIVFALGLNGGGGPFLPPLVESLPEHLRSHTEDPIDFEALRGKRVLILGGGASGFDNAGTALEYGAASVAIHIRKNQLPTQNSLRWMEFPGMQEHFYELSDDHKWEFSLYNGGLPQPPTQASVWRSFDYDNFDLRTGVEWDTVTVRNSESEGNEEILVTDADGHVTVADYIISATGYRTDLGLRPELAQVLDDIALWRDEYVPAIDHPMGRCPYLGNGFQFQAKASASPAAHGYIPRLFHLSTGARVSHGVAGNQLSGIFAGVTRLSYRIAQDITQENWTDFFDGFQTFRNEEVACIGKHREGMEWFPQAPRY